MHNQYVSDEVSAVIELYKEMPQTSSVLELLKQKAERVFQGHRIRKMGAYVEISNGFPPLFGKSIDEVFKYDFTRQNAYEVASKIHGFNSWDEGERTNAALNPDFEKAVDLMLAGNLDELTRLLEKHPQLISEQSGYPHHATLLHYCGSNGIETERQVVPYNIAEIAQILIDFGANKSAKMNVYGSQHTTLELASTSAHPKRAGLERELLKILK